MQKGQILGRLSQSWRGLSLWIKYAIVIVIASLVIGTLYIVNSSGGAVTTDVPNPRAVQVASVSDLQNDTTPLPLIGEVKSVNEAKIHSQSAGTITHLYKKLGSYVPAGGVIAEIENNSARAALLQAQGALEAAQAGVQKGDRLFEESKKSALDTIKSVYSSNDDLVRSRLDVMFSNPTSDVPRFVLSVSNQSLLNKVESERLQLGSLLREQASRTLLVSENSNLAVEIQTAIEETRQIKAYIDDLSALLNVSITSQTYPQSAIDGFITTASAARTAVSVSLASLTGASQALISAQNNSEKPEEVSASSAALKQAQASVQVAEANLEKTIIRSPISGTINNISIDLGDFVSAYQQVAIVSNNGSLEIVAHITPEDQATISVGAKVKIENEFDGFVSSIAPAIDPTTKKIEIKIGLVGTHEFTNGESVHLDIVRNPKKTAAKTPVIMLPISSVKIGADSSAVFTIGEDRKLVAHEVTTGDLVGDKIQIMSGVTDDMMLVTDARGLKDGQQVDLR
jgi:RND family efflux transporter MFP subunit